MVTLAFFSARCTEAFAYAPPRKRLQVRAHFRFALAPLMHINSEDVPEKSFSVDFLMRFNLIDWKIQLSRVRLQIPKRCEPQPFCQRAELEVLRTKRLRLAFWAAFFATFFSAKESRRKKIEKNVYKD